MSLTKLSIWTINTKEISRKKMNPNAETDPFGNKCYINYYNMGLLFLFFKFL